jgi:hypothetical protein
MLRTAEASPAPAPGCLAKPQHDTPIFLEYLARCGRWQGANKMVGGALFGLDGVHGAMHGVTRRDQNGPFPPQRFPSGKLRDQAGM